MQFFQISFELRRAIGRRNRLFQVCRICRRQNLPGSLLQFVRLLNPVVPVFIHQPLESRQIVIQAGIAHRRRLVPNQAGGAAPLRLHSFTDDRNQIGINIRQIAQRQFRIAFTGQSGRLARQPFQRTVRADVQHRVRTEPIPQPGVKPQIMMRRRTIRRMVDLGRVFAKAARRLDADHDIAQSHSRHQQAVPLDKDLPRSSPPIGRHLLRRFFRQLGKPFVVFFGAKGSQIIRRRLFPYVLPFIGPAGNQPVHQFLAVCRQFTHLIARLLHAP